ncbi:MAG: hypothetical protein B6D61_06080 [Bacteroidetes bacterium 4484_249]|nr:MAG: hypothetical protein B6D61_06080 [Bacteroidetes bacterium 4484_249]
MQDIFITKINHNGKVIKANSYGGSGSDKSNSIFAKSDGSIVFVGYFQGEATFDNKSIIANNQSDVFIAVFDENRKDNMILSFGDISQEKINSLICDHNNNIIFTGSFRKSFTFGSEYYVSNGRDDIFIAKLRNVKENNYQTQANSYSSISSENIKIQVIPNPTNGKIDIYILGILDEHTDIDLKDIFGRTIFTKKDIIKNHFDINLSGKNNGIYLLTIKTQNKTFIEKIIKQ